MIHANYYTVYKYDNTTVRFNHTFLSGTGCSDLGNIPIMPVTEILKLNPKRADKPDLVFQYRSHFSHITEKTSSEYYEVILDTYKVKARFT